jgi:diguanylate cyclase (GGDEF)-like protein/PAS domain S-box-containing protein
MNKDYCELVNGMEIGPTVGSCGTAAYNKQRIIVEDIATSPLWTLFKDIAEQYELKSCWSTPIISSKSQVTGTFAVYHSEVKKPSSQDLELIDYFVHFSSIALERESNADKLAKLISELKHSNDKFKAFTNVMPDLALILSEDGVYVDIYGCNDGLICTSFEDIKGKNVNNLLPEKDALPIMAVIEKTLTTNEMQIFEYELDGREGQVIFEGRSTPIEHYTAKNTSKRHILWVARDITQRKMAEKEIENLAYYDPLTTLPNRRMLHERLDITVEKIKHSGQIGALFFIDLDNFKRFNDSLGHSVADELLVEVTARLGAVIQKSDTLARIGGDEFVLLLEYIATDNAEANKQASFFAQKLHDIFNQKFKIGIMSYQVSCSVGICLIEGSDITASNILKFADTAMYRSKAKGGNSFSFYDPQLQSILLKQINLETDIIRALEQDEFCAYFQPQVDIMGNIIGAEALIRWAHPVKGTITPVDFISLAEQFGLIQRLQNIVLKDICKLLNKLDAEQVNCPSFNISINISPSQFKSSSLKNELLNVIQEFAVDTSQITLEITESMLAHDVEHTVQQMEELKEQGFTFSIDDFGTGYSCLAYLHAYPVKELKIDKSFIDRIFDEKSGLSIVETVINLARNLKINVIAEGVEKIEQFNILKEKKVDALQGYLFAKPMPMNEYIDWHRNQKSNSAIIHKIANQKIFTSN